MRILRRRILSGLLLIMWGSYAWAADELLLQTILQKNQAAVDSVVAAEVKFSWIMLGTMPGMSREGVSYEGGPVQTTGESTQWKLGDWYRQDVEYTTIFTAGNRPDMLENRTIVYTDTQFFLLNRLTGNLGVYELESREKLYPPVDRIHNTYPLPNILNFAFTVEEKRLAEVVQRPDLARVTVEELKRDEETYYEILVFVKHKGGEQLRLKVQVDPQKQFMVAGYTYFDLDGEISLEHRATFQELAPGVWFPREITQEHANSTVGSFHFTVTRVSINDKLEKTIFDWEQQDIKRPGMQMFRMLADGKTHSSLHWTESGWVPSPPVTPDVKNLVNTNQGQG